MGTTALLPDSMRTPEQESRFKRAEEGLRRSGLAMGRALKLRGGTVGMTHALFRACTEFYEASEAGKPKDGES